MEVSPDPLSSDRAASPGTSTGLCDICSRINIESLSSPDGFPHIYHKVTQENGCPLCNHVFNDIEYHGVVDDDTPIRIKLFQQHSSMGLVTWFLRIEVGNRRISTEVLVFTSEGDPAAVTYGVSPFKPVTSNGSPKTLSIATDWLKHCVHNHSCHQSIFVPGQGKSQQSDRLDKATNRSTIYPTRVLDLESFIEDSMDSQLIWNLAPDTPYATLSHCWGSMSQTRYQATTSTLLSLKERIPYQYLPRTYRDAISVCRALKIRYLWIDSLCIIQDSKEDWAREAANMAHVYSNSYLTISADWSTNSDGGCFKMSSQKPGTDISTAIRVTNVLSTGQRSCLYFPHRWSRDQRDLNSTPLAGRAWAYQERLLSRRNLHFTQDQVFWECRSEFAGEDMAPRRSGILVPAQVLPQGWYTINYSVYIWCRIVEKYSHARITFPTDRLPAISALANLAANHLCCPYLAGLWLEGLWYTLSWYQNTGQEVERPKDYIAPSWSWASVNAGVGWLIILPSSFNIKQRTEVLDVMVQHVNDPFGQVSGGWIRVTGPFAESIDPSTRGTTRFLDYVFPDYPQETPPGKVHCLLLAERSNAGPFLETAHFLLLVTSSKDPNVYERWGVGRKDSDITTEQWQEKTITII